jgi:hypothetical protein
MSIYTIPAPGAPAEDWGRVAVSLPGWRWMPGMLARNFDGPVRVESVTDDQPGVLHRCRWTGNMTHADIRSMPLPDPDDPATEGCLLRLLGDRALLLDLPSAKTAPGLWRAFVSRRSPCFTERMPLGRACIAAAAALGRWPGGEG